MSLKTAWEAMIAEKMPNLRGPTARLKSFANRKADDFFLIITHEGMNSLVEQHKINHDISEGERSNLIIDVDSFCKDLAKRVKSGEVAMECVIYLCRDHANDLSDKIMKVTQEAARNKDKQAIEKIIKTTMELDGFINETFEFIETMEKNLAFSRKQLNTLMFNTDLAKRKRVSFFPVKDLELHKQQLRTINEISAGIKKHDMPQIERALKDLTNELHEETGLIHEVIRTFVDVFIEFEKVKDEMTIKLIDKLKSTGLDEDAIKHIEASFENVSKELQHTAEVEWEEAKRIHQRERTEFNNTEQKERELLKKSS